MPVGVYLGQNKNYSAFNLEYIAFKWAVTEKFSDYFTNTNFTVYTGSNPLTHILSSAKLNATGQLSTSTSSTDLA